MRSAIIALSVLTVVVIGTGVIMLAGGGHGHIATDILVTRYDAGSAEIWNVTIDSGKDDYATSVIQTSDGGYAVAGWAADYPVSSHRLRVVRLDGTGKTLWDRTLDGPDVYSADIAEDPDGGFFVAANNNNFDSGTLWKIDASGSAGWNRTTASAYKAIVPLRDGGFVLAGNPTFILDKNGTTKRQLRIPSTTVLPAAGSNLYLGQSGVPYIDASVYHIDENGTVIWALPVGSRESGSIASMQENAEGDLEVLYTFRDSKKDKNLVMYMESELVTVDMGGNISGRMPLAAVDPVCRTSDGGYAFLAYPFPDTAAFTNNPYAGSSLHMVLLSPGGTVVRDTPVPHLPAWIAPRQIIQTRDGGFLTVIVTGS